MGVDINKMIPKGTKTVPMSLMIDEKRKHKLKVIIKEFNKRDKKIKNSEAIRLCIDYVFESLNLGD